MTYQRTKRDLSGFAEVLAETGSVAAAAREIGVSRKVGWKHFNRICNELGVQAA